MLVAIISDTHMPRGPRALPAGCLERLAAADLILHLGDLITTSVLRDLEGIGPPLKAVRGNVDEPDLQRLLPLELVVEAETARIGMVHDAGPAKGRLRRLWRRFPEAGAVIFGHSHLPVHEEEVGFQIFNPGSPTERRRAPSHTMGMLEVHGEHLDFALVHLD